MWLALAFVSAILLGFYDTSKKASLKDNAVLPVLLLNTIFSTLIFSPFLIDSAGGGRVVQRELSRYGSVWACHTTN